MAHVVVVGAGMSGLVAALRLRESGHDVTVLAQRLGGQIKTVDLAGARVDVGAEAIHLGTPQVGALVRELGLRERVIGAEPGASLLQTRRGLVPLPAGVGPTGPTRVMPVLRSRILGPLTLLRAGLEPVTARLSGAADVSVGAFVRRRFGRTVTHQFVDPLLGNLHGGDIDRLSLRATAAQLVPAAEQRRSLLLRKAPPPPPPGAIAFATFVEGLELLPRTLAEHSGAVVRTGVRVTALEPDVAGWRVHSEDETLAADGVVLAVPGAAAAPLLEPLVPGGPAAARLESASVAVVALALDGARARANEALTSANGILLASDQARVLKAATFLTHKWSHLAGLPDYLLRASVGRAGSRLAEDLSDDEIVDGVLADLRRLIGLDAGVTGVHIERWPHAMPQLTLGHLERLASLRARLAPLPPLVLAGAPFDGLGIGSVIKSGERWAGELAARLG